MFSEGNAAHPVGCDSPLQIVMAVWGTFFLNFELAGSCVADYLCGANFHIASAKQEQKNECKISEIVCTVQCTVLATSPTI
jgi:hypothetical protein